MKTLCALLIAGLLWFGYARFTAPLTYPPGVLIAAEPEQTELPPETAGIMHGDFQLQPLARFKLEARILHRKNYRFDRSSKLAPVDLAVGWGAMSDQAVLDRMEITQSMRFYFYEYRLPPPIPKEEIIRHSTNIHIIPADDTIASACKSLRVGDLVRLEGQLVEATGPEVKNWRSSLRRDDTGNGACELFLVERVEKLEPQAGPSPRSALVSR